MRFRLLSSQFARIAEPKLIQWLKIWIQRENWRIFSDWLIKVFLVKFLPGNNRLTLPSMKAWKRRLLFKPDGLIETWKIIVTYSFCTRGIHPNRNECMRMRIRMRDLFRAIWWIFRHNLEDKKKVESCLNKRNQNKIMFETKIRWCYSTHLKNQFFFFFNRNLLNYNGSSKSKRGSSHIHLD